MKLAFFGLENWEHEYFKTKLKRHKIVHTSRTHLTDSSLKKIKDIEGLVIFIYSKITEEVLDSLPKLKLITTMSTGFDHIDLKACKKRGIQVFNVPSYGSHTVAEHTFALILALARNLVASVARTRRSDFSLKGLRGIDLCGKTIGVVGVGKIGSNVVQIANGMGMNVIASTRKADPKKEKKLKYRRVSFDYLLKNSDIITFHVPLTKETEFMINMDSIKKVKKGAILINTARGNLIDSNAIIYGIEKKILSGAGLDVLEDECYIMEERQILDLEFRKECNMGSIVENHVLMKYDNVIITPHNAFNTIDALNRILDVTVENITKNPGKNRIV